MKYAKCILFTAIIFIILNSIIIACPPGNDWDFSEDPNSTKDPNSPTDPNNLPNPNPSDAASGSDPITVKGEYYYQAKDIVIPGRTMDVVIKRTYRQDYYNGESGSYKVDFDLNLEPPSYVNDCGVSYTSGVYDHQYELGGNCSTFEGTYRVTPCESGPQTLTLWVELRVYDGSQWSWDRAEHEIDVYPSEYSSPFGHNWDMNYNIKIYDEGETLYLNTGQAKVVPYEFKTGTSPREYYPDDATGRYDYIVKNTDDTFKLFKKNGNEFIFNTDGRITSITNPKGSEISFAYTGNKLTTITDDLGRDITLQYNGIGQLTTITDFENRSWNYTYYYNHNLTKVEGPYNYSKQYQYGDYTKHLIEEVTDPNGQTYIVNDYDQNDRVTTQTYGDYDTTFDYDTEPNAVIILDPNGFYTLNEYEGNGLITSKIDYTYNPQDDPNQYETQYVHNDHAETTRIIYPAGNCVDYEYDDSGNLLGVLYKSDPDTDDPNLYTQFTYSDYFNQIKTITDPKENVYTFTYDYDDPCDTDPNGLLTKVTFPQVTTENGQENPEIEFTYNVYGQMETITAPDGIVTKYVYCDTSNDPNYGRVIEIISDYSTTDPCALNISTYLKNDKLGNIIEIEDPEGNITQFEYDDYNKLTKVTDALDNITKLTYNPNLLLTEIEREIGGSSDPNQIVSYTYNILDKVRTITDPLGKVTTIGYDENYNKASLMDPEGQQANPQYQTSYAHDERDQLTSVTNANDHETIYAYNLNGDLDSATDPNGNTTYYDYDDFDRLICITYPNDSNEVFYYDDNSNLTSFENRNGDTISYQYDALNRLIQKNWPGNTRQINYYYDISGRLTDVNDVQSGVLFETNYYYDRLGRLEAVVDPWGHQVDYDYDDVGRRTKLVYPNDDYITYGYDELSRLIWIKDDSDANIVEYDYDELSRRTEMRYANGSVTKYEYDLKNQIEAIKIDVNGDQVYDANDLVYEYTYDDVGNRETLTIDSTNLHEYTYDDIYQLLVADYPVNFDFDDTTYEYDDVFNRKKVTEGTTDTNYSLNQSGLNQYGTVGSDSLSYDNNGNLSQNGSFKYYYDCENHLIDVNDLSNANKETYTYDYAGRRIERYYSYLGNPAGRVYLRHVYDGPHVIETRIYDSSETYFGMIRFIYGPGMDQPVCMLRFNSQGTLFDTCYYHQDASYSVIGLSSDAGAIVQKYKYDVYGNMKIYSADDQLLPDSAYYATWNPYFFTGRRLDHETGLYYYRARMYNPETGRFLQPDPVGYADCINIYTYCYNNPINYIDPLGLGFWSWAKNVGVGALSGAATGAVAGLICGGPPAMAAGAMAGAIAGGISAGVNDLANQAAGDGHLSTKEAAASGGLAGATGGAGAVGGAAAGAVAGAVTGGASAAIESGGDIGATAAGAAAGAGFGAAGGYIGGAGGAAAQATGAAASAAAETTGKAIGQAGKTFGSKCPK